MNITTIGSICSVGDGAHAKIKRFDDGVPYLTCRNLKGGRLDLSEVYYISKEDYARYFLKKSNAITRPEPNDLLFSSIGTIGEPYLVRPTDHFGISSSVAIVRPNLRLLSPLFLFFWISGPDFQSALRNIKGGVAQGYVSLEMIRSLPLHLPSSLRTQRKIAAILSTYDDLIENNTRCIAILEEMAQALYREWFVRFRFPGHENIPLVDSPLGQIPEGWMPVKVEDAIFINPRTTVPREGEKPFVSMGAVPQNTLLIDVAATEMRTGNSGSKFQNGDSLFARITPCLENGKTAYVQFLPTPEAVAFGSTEFIVLRSKTVCPEFVYLLARSDAFRDNAIKSMSGATGRQRVQEKCFDNFFFAHPDTATLSTFAELIKPLFKKVFVLSKKNANLRKTRDLLLPKLISGQLDVEHLDIDIGGSIAPVLEATA